MDKLSMIWRITTKLFLGSLMSLAVMLCVILGYLSSDHGKTTLIQQINAHLTNHHRVIDVKSITNLFPLTLKINTLALKHPPLPDETLPNTHWLRLTNATLHINMSHVFSRQDRLVSLTLAAENVFLDQLPLDQQQGPETASFALETIKEDLKKALPFNIEAFLTLDHLTLAPSYVGQALTVGMKKCQVTYKRLDHNLTIKADITTSSFGKPLTLSLRCDGPLDRFNGDVSLQTKALTYNGITLTDVMIQNHATGLPFDLKNTLEATFTHQGQTGTLELDTLSISNNILNLKGLRLKGLDANLQAHASYDFKSSDLLARVKGHIQNLHALSQLVSIPMTGSLGIDTQINRSQDQETIHANLTAQNISMPQLTIKDMTANVNVAQWSRKPTARLKIHTNTMRAFGIDSDHTTIDAKIDKGKGVLSTHAIGPNLTLNILSDLAFTPNRQTITVQKAHCIYHNQPIKTTKPFSVTVSQEGLTLSPLQLSIVSFPLSLEGKTSGDNVNFHIKGTGDLGLLSKLFLYSGDIVDGTLTFDGSLQGMRNDLVADGFIDIKDGAYENIMWGTKFHNIQARLSAKDSQIVLDKVSLHDGHDGLLTMKGLYDLKTDKIAASLHLVNMRLAYTDTIYIEGREGDLNLSGTSNDMLLKGYLKTGTIDYNLTKILAAEIPTLNLIDPDAPHQNVLTGEQNLPVTSNDDSALALDLSIEIPPTLTIFGMGLDSLWGGNLTIKGPANTLDILGSITAKRGTISFLGKNIRIDKGDIRFDGYKDNIPYLTLHAHLQQADYSVMVDLIGRASDPHFTLTSDPSQPHNEIIATLLFGSNTKELSAFDAIKLAKTVAEFQGITSGKSFSSVLKSNKDIMGKKASKKGDTPDHTKSDRHLSDYVHVSLEQGTTPSNTKVQVDIDVSPRVTVTTETSLGESSQSLGVNYRWTY